MVLTVFSSCLEQADLVDFSAVSFCSSMNCTGYFSGIIHVPHLPVVVVANCLRSALHCSAALQGKFHSAIK